jgi:RimJ/RimL family protein N-acetyltransferase/predicted Fe-S protein YdhL (DUF1289 family)
MNDIELRPIQYSDAPVINKIRNQSAEYLHDDRKFTEENTLEWLRIHDPDWYAIVINEEMVGYFRLSNYSKENRNLYIGADIAEEHRGKGLGYRAYLIMMKKLFNERKLNKITLEVLSNNKRAFKLYKKLGFSIEGTKRQEVWRINEWIDSIVMSITRKEFMLNHQNILASPCIGICHKNDHICSSCGRTIDQIREWKDADDDRKELILIDMKPKTCNKIKDIIV